MDNSQVAIPFIKYDVETQGFHISEEAIQFLSGIEGKIGVISVCGKYRTGKSYLMNKLFMDQLKERRKTQDVKGFQVGPTINACTKGLWIWKEVFYSEADEDKQLPILIVDTEGLGAFDEEQNHDTKIFLLAMLLCSLMIYNSMGPIDENALNNLSLIVNLSKSLQIKKGEAATDADEMAQYFPSFLWILRDFALRLEDQDGNMISQKKYLENSLKEQKGVSDAIEAKNRIRRLVSQFFQDRDCHTLVRPVEQENKLQNLNDIKNEQLRSEFVTQMDYLRKKVFKKVKPKQLRGQFITGKMLIELAEAYTEALNKGGIPVIETAWEYMQSGELENAFKDSLRLHESLLTKLLNQLPISDDSIITACKQIKSDCLLNFQSKTLGDMKNTKNQNYLKKLKLDFKEKRSICQKKNNDVIKSLSIQLLDQIVNQSIRTKQYTNMVDVQADFNYVQQQFLEHLAKQFGLKENLMANKCYYEYVNDKFNTLAQNIFYQNNQAIQNEGKVMADKLKHNETELSALRSELAYSRDSMNTQIQESEQKRIKLNSQVTSLEQKLYAKNEEIQKLKINGFSQNQSQNDEINKKVKLLELNLGKKEAEVRDLVDSNVKKTNELKKNIALLEQKIDLQNRHINTLENQLDEKGDSGRVKSKEIQEMMDIIKELKKENKQMRAKQNGNSNELILELEKQRKENLALEKIIKNEQNQYIKLHEKLIQTEKKLKPRNNNTNVESSKYDEMQQQLQDFEQSNKVLRRIKNAYKQASEIKCRGCDKNFKPVIFKGHILNCHKLFEDSFSEIASQSDIDQVYVRVTKYDEFSKDLHFHIKFGSQNVQIREFDKYQKFSIFQDLLLTLAEQFQEIEAFKGCPEFEKIVFIDAEGEIPNDLVKNANGLMARVTNIFALKTSQEFKNFFGITPEDERAPELGSVSTSGSLLRQTASAAKKSMN